MFHLDIVICQTVCVFVRLGITVRIVRLSGSHARKTAPIVHMEIATVKQETALVKLVSREQIVHNLFVLEVQSAIIHTALATGQPHNAFV